MLKKLLAALSVVIVATTAAYAVGLWPGLPLLGGASYCAGYSQYNTGNTVPGAAPSGQCSSTVPAGASAFNGYEGFPVDSYGLEQGAGSNVTSAAPQTQMVGVLQLGQGPFVLNTATSAIQIPAATQWFVVNGTATNPTVTLPANPVAGQIVHIILGANLTTGITTAAGAGATACVPACGALAGTTAGTTYTFVFNPGNSDWYRIQ